MISLREATASTGIAGAAGASAAVIRRAPPGLSPEVAFLLGMVPDEDESWIPSGTSYLDLHEWARTPHRGVFRWMSELDASAPSSDADVVTTLEGARSVAGELSAKLFREWHALVRVQANMQRARGRFPKPVRDSLADVAAGIDALMGRASDLRKRADRALGRLAPAAPTQ